MLTILSSHSNRFWHESRDLVTYRMHTGPRLDLLGRRVNDFNLLKPKWRNLIRLSESPWLTDYKIRDSLVVPFSSMLCSVLEAARQLVEKDDAVKDFELRNVRFREAPAMTSDEYGICLSLRMKPSNVGTQSSENTSHHFSIYSESLEEVIEHCTGVVQTHLETQNHDKTCDTEDIREMAVLEQEFVAFEKEPEHELEPKNFYEMWSLHGLQWGEKSGISNMTSISADTIDQGLNSKA